MKNIFKILILLTVFGFTVSGCKKDFVTVTPIGVVNSSSFYANRTTADEAVTSVYGMLNYIQNWDVYILADLGSIASDDAEAGGNDPGDSPPFQDIDKFVFTPSENSVFTETYGVLYKAIMLANTAIAQLPTIAKSNPDSADLNNFISERLGEVKFLRALNFFYLTQIYGEVPLVDHVLGSSEYEMGRSSLRSVYDLIESDLNYAISVLPVSYASAGDIGRATKGAAEGLLAKVYLFESSYAHYYQGDVNSVVNPGQSRFKDLNERWQDALTMAENVINSGKYTLVGINGERYHSWRDKTATTSNTDGFRYIFTSSGNNSKEAVFEIQEINVGIGWPGARGSSMVNWTGPRWYFNKKGVSTTTGLWGFNIPSPNLVAEFDKEPGDPRFNTTIHKDTIGGNDSIQATSSGWSKIAYGYQGGLTDKTGMYQAKYECSYSEFLGSKTYAWPEDPMNVKILRYSDVVLIAAEAAIMAGDNAKALNYINMVRTRARMCGPVGNTIPADLTGTVTIDQLRHERRLELAMEGNRFYDLVRWNIAQQTLNGMQLGVGYTVQFESPKNDFYPLPQQEVDISKGNLKQYQGW